jgi:hypothetical protein
VFGSHVSWKKKGEWLAFDYYYWQRFYLLGISGEMQCVRVCYGDVLTREGKNQVHLLNSSKPPFFRYILSVFYSSKKLATSAVISVFFLEVM